MTDSNFSHKVSHLSRPAGTQAEEDLADLYKKAQDEQAAAEAALRKAEGLEDFDPTTWTDDKWPPAVGGTGILPWFGVGQSAFMWHVGSGVFLDGRVAATFMSSAGVERRLFCMGVER